jgi:5-methylcytosine-specific restriction endonuclease McrBC regulatory subunit McrC
MFLASTSISEKVGAHEFRGFLLNMNTLFEEFVQQAFINVVRYTTASAAIQKPEPLSMNKVAPMVKPDITIRERATIVSIADAKYKRDAAGPRNPDIYQVVTYGTVLKCPRTYLMYPHTELVTEHDFRILNSPITVHTRRINIPIPDCVKATEAIAREIVTESQRHEQFTFMPEAAGQNGLATAL